MKQTLSLIAAFLLILILSADGDSIIYSVPDVVADRSEEYCSEFCCRWLWNSPDAAKYRKNGSVCYTQRDLIDYLNTYKSPEQKSILVLNLGWTESDTGIPTGYRSLPYFDF